MSYTSNPTVNEMNRSLLDFGASWPKDRSPFANLPVSSGPDLQLYLAAGAYYDGPPLPPDLSYDKAHQLAEEVLRNARLELGVALGARYQFARGDRDPLKVKELCASSVRDIARDFQHWECALDPSDEETRVFITEKTQQVVYWEGEYERLSRHPHGLAAANLCTLRQLAGGFTMMVENLLDHVWGATDERFENFHDAIVAVMPDCDFRNSGPQPAGDAAVAPEQTP